MAAISKEPVGPRKKPYVKPSVKQVELRPEEAVLGACKTVAVSGPNLGGNCTPPSCSTLGS